MSKRKTKKTNKRVLAISALIVILATMATLLLILNSKNNILSPTAANQTLPADLVLETNRAVLRSAWLADARHVAERSGISDALAVVRFVETNNILTEPVQQGGRYLEAGNGQNWFSLYPLIVGDDRISPKWSEYYSPSEAGVAHFSSVNRALIVKSHIRMSSVWRGIIIIHEGNHAMTFLAEHHKSEDRQVFCDDERDTHELQNKVTEAVGGEAYTRFVNALADELKQKIDQKGYQVGQVFVEHDRHYPELDEIFGPHESGLELNFRETSVWIHANFIMLERAFGTSAPEHKSKFLFSLYKKSGVLK